MEAKAKAEEMKKKLEQMEVKGESYDGEVTIIANGSRKVLSVHIKEEIFTGKSRPEIEHLIKEAVNDATTKADRMMAEEMKAIMPNIPGLGV